VLFVALCATAVAETPDELVRRGEELARIGRYSEAIDAFKAADRADPKASRACLIALAYIRRELWPQAEIYLARCRERATAAAPVPDWVPLAEQQLRERLTTVNVAAIEIVVEPAGVAQLSVSSFAPDEVFAPRTIHLPPGLHIVTARAPGYEDAQRSIEVTDRTPQRVTIKLHSRVVEHVHGKLPWYVIGAGGAIAVAAGIYHATAYRSAYNRLEATHDITDYSEAVAQYKLLEPDYRSKQRIVWGLYGAGAATLITGVALRLAGVGDVDVEVLAAPGGGGVAVGWRR
jgi:tetratricopeptide (TPR) repeat protein